MPILDHESDIYPEHLLFAVSASSRHLRSHRHLESGVSHDAPAERVGAATRSAIASRLTATFQMPILDHESDIYPEHLLEPAGESSVEPWWALYTLPRREKELMRRLRALELPFYGPIVPQRKKSPQGRVRTSYLPLFSGYVFMRGDDESRRAALTSNCTSRCLTVPGCGPVETTTCGRFAS